jgi:hypothetical protein
MKVDYDLKTNRSSPVYRRIDIDCCALDVGRAKGIIRPVANRYADDVEAGLRDLVEVLPCRPGVPVFSEDLERCVMPQLLA